MEFFKKLYIIRGNVTYFGIEQNFKLSVSNTKVKINLHRFTSSRVCFRGFVADALLGL